MLVPRVSGRARDHKRTGLGVFHVNFQKKNPLIPRYCLVSLTTDASWSF